MKTQSLDGVFVMYLSIERDSVDLSIGLAQGPKAVLNREQSVQNHGVIANRC